MRISGQISTAQFKELVKDPRARLIDQGEPKRSNKYGAVPVHNGHDHFDSGHEARIVDRLRLLEQQGYIENLKTDKRQLRFALDVNGVRICDYEADAIFDVVKDFDFHCLAGAYLLRAGTHQVLDAKSQPTRKKRDYVLKRNLMLALYDVKILEA
jgi:hypothetical protein